jgi:hypothetical protein
MMGGRLRLWLEPAECGYFLRDAESGEPVRWSDPRLRVLPVAGVSYRAEALPDQSFDPGRPLALVPEPDVAPELEGDEQALSLWRVDGGLRVLVVPGDAWIGRPR